MCPPVVAVAASYAFSAVAAPVVASAFAGTALATAIGATATGILTSVVTGALVGGMTSVVMGGKFGQGALMGAAGGLISGSVTALNGGFEAGAAGNAAAPTAAETAANPSGLSKAELTYQPQTSELVGGNVPSAMSIAPPPAGSSTPAAGQGQAPKTTAGGDAAGNVINKTSTDSVWSKAIDKLTSGDMIKEIGGKAIAGGFENMAKTKAARIEQQGQMDIARLQTNLEKNKYAGLGTKSGQGYLDASNTATAKGTVPDYTQYYGDNVRRNGALNVNPASLAPTPVPVV